MRNKRAPRLQVIRLDNRITHPPCYVLADAEGQVFPGQVMTVVSKVGEMPRFTVEFVVDDDEVILGDGVPLEAKGTLKEAAEAYAALSPDNRRRFWAMHDLEHRPKISKAAVLTVTAGLRSRLGLDKPAAAAAPAAPWDRA